MTFWRLTVDRDEFADALEKAAYGVRKNSAFDIRLEKSDDGLLVAGLGTSVSVPASGDWPAVVLIPGTTAKKLAGVLPKLLPFIIEIEGQTLRISGFSIGVKVMHLAPKRVALVVNATSRDVLISIARHGEPKTRASVGAKMVDKAKFDAANSIAKAFHALEALGVKRSEVESLVENSLKRQAGKE